jgi:hypothetical protein
MFFILFTVLVATIGYSSELYKPYSRRQQRVGQTAKSYCREKHQGAVGAVFILVCG